VPLIEICEMLTADCPRLLSVTVADCFAPTVTLPKSSLAGLRLSCPAADVPVPDKERFVTESEAVLAMAAVALKAPAAFGVKRTVIGVLFPAARVVGRVGAVREKYFVEIAALFTVTEAVPEFVAVTVRVLLLPVVTLPKFKAAFEMVSAPLCCC